jgi:hypothetical protein
MERETAGDPISGLKWTRKTTEKIARQLKRLGITVSRNTVRKTSAADHSCPRQHFGGVRRRGIASKSDARDAAGRSATCGAVAASYRRIAVRRALLST